MSSRAFGRELFSKERVVGSISRYGQGIYIEKCRLYNLQPLARSAHQPYSTHNLLAVQSILSDFSDLTTSTSAPHCRKLLTELPFRKKCWTSSEKPR